jgi:hypothetical protein
MSCWCLAGIPMLSAEIKTFNSHAESLKLHSLCFVAGMCIYVFSSYNNCGNTTQNQLFVSLLDTCTSNQYFYIRLTDELR